jgi:L-asparaginase
MSWISPSLAETLSDKFMKVDNYKRLEVIGELVMP